MSPTTPTPALDLTGLTPAQLDERLAQIEAAQVAARAEAAARADAHQARYETARTAWFRTVLDGYVAFETTIEAEVRAHRTAFIEAARAADLPAAIAAWRADVVVRKAQGRAFGQYANARSALGVDPNVVPMPASPPLAWADDFWKEFVAEANNGMAPDAEARYLAEFGPEPQFEEFAE